MVFNCGESFKFYPELYTDERFVDRYGCSVSRFITLKWCSRGNGKGYKIFRSRGDLQLINHMLSKEHIRLVQYLSASRELEEIKETCGIKIGQTIIQIFIYS